MKHAPINTKFATLGLLLLAIALSAGCGKLVIMDDDGFAALHEAKNTTRVISIEGNVTDSEGKPLENISVIVIGRYMKDTQVFYGGNYRELDTLTTDANGFYKMTQKTVTPAFPDLQLDASDSQGRYSTVSIIVLNVQAGTVAPTIILQKN